MQQRRRVHRIPRTCTKASANIGRTYFVLEGEISGSSRAGSLSGLVQPLPHLATRFAALGAALGAIGSFAAAPRDPEAVRQNRGDR